MWPLTEGHSGLPILVSNFGVRGCDHEQFHIVASLTHLPPGQNGRYFQEDILKCFLMNEKFCILIKISPKFVPKGPINNVPALVQIMAWRPSGDKPLSEPVVIQFTDAYMRH